MLLVFLKFFFSTTRENFLKAEYNIKYNKIFIRPTQVSCHIVSFCSPDRVRWKFVIRVCLILALTRTKQCCD